MKGNLMFSFYCIFNRCASGTPFWKANDMKAYVINGTFDLPAWCLVCNMIQFNGHCGCGLCDEPGETARSGNGFSHVYCMSHESQNHEWPCKSAYQSPLMIITQRAIISASTVRDSI